MNRRRFLATSVAAGLSAVLCAPLKRKQPNILFAIADDWSWPHAGVYGCQFVDTPAFDRLAQEGILFHNVFCAAPQCSPNRASILTGRYIWQNEEAGTHASLFPTKLKVFTDMLESAGYTLGYTGKPWGPGNWKDSGWNRNPAGPQFSSIQYDRRPPQGIRNLDYAANFRDFLTDKSENSPFFFWYGASEPHRSYAKGIGIEEGKSIENVTVPKFLPDHPEIRSDLLDYAVEVEWFDRHLGDMLKLLEERGELDNTLIVATSDNGMPFPRAKANLYEYGIHMPLAIRWGNQVKSGRESEKLISFVDFAPTFLRAAGLDVPEDMSGMSFLEHLLSPDSGRSREHILAGRERHTHARPDNLGYPSRCIRTDQFLYIWNMKPDRWPAGDPEGSGEPEGYHDIDGCPSKTFMLEFRSEYPKLVSLALDKRPEEELYDIQNDPYCLNNLAVDPDFQDVKSSLHATLEQVLTETQDPRVMGNGDIWESYPRFNRMRDFPGFKKQGEYNPEYQSR